MCLPCRIGKLFPRGVAVPPLGCLLVLCLFRGVSLRPSTPNSLTSMHNSENTKGKLTWPASAPPGSGVSNRLHKLLADHDRNLAFTNSANHTSSAYGRPHAQAQTVILKKSQSCSGLLSISRRGPKKNGFRRRRNTQAREVRSVYKNSCYSQRRKSPPSLPCEQEGLLLPLPKTRIQNQEPSGLRLQAFRPLIAPILHLTKGKRKKQRREKKKIPKSAVGI